MKFKLSLCADNKKTGPIPLVSSSKTTCPISCPLKDVCYAKFGHASIQWNNVERLGGSYKKILQKIAKFPKNTLWRFGVYGDFYGNGRILNFQKMKDLVKANLGKRGYGYTHYSAKNKQNYEVIKFANRNGFTLNLSADNLNQADEYFDLGIAPVVVIVKSDVRKDFKTPKGRKVVICKSHEGKQCWTCGICAKRNHPIVAFPAHGVKKRKIDEMLENERNFGLD
jgi:hypothetical protein